MPSQCNSDAKYWELIQILQVKVTVPNNTALTSTAVATLGGPASEQLTTNLRVPAITQV